MPRWMAVFAHDDFHALFPDIFDADANNAQDVTLRDAASAQPASAPRSVPVFTEGEPPVLSPDIFDADANNAQDVTLRDAASAQPASAPRSVPVFTEGEPSVLFPDNFNASQHQASRLHLVLFPDNFDADAHEASRLTSVPMFTEGKASVLFPGNFNTDKNYGTCRNVANALRLHGHAAAMGPPSGDDDNDLSFLCLDSGLQRWERLAPDDQARDACLGPSVQAFERIAGHEGKKWKRALRRLQPYGSVLMRDGMLEFACRHDLHRHLVLPRTVRGYVEAWLAYNNVSVLVQEVHARHRGTDPATHGLLCEMAHDMYRQAMLAAALGQRKRAVWFYDTNTRKKRKFSAWDARQ